MSKAMVELPDGMQYRVTHVRNEGPSVVSLDDHIVYEQRFNPKGGKTIVEIGFPKYDAKGKFTHFDAVVIAEAQCHEKDHYNRKRGRDIALGRAIKALKAEGYSLAVK